MFFILFIIFLITWIHRRLSSISKLKMMSSQVLFELGLHFMRCSYTILLQPINRSTMTHTIILLLLLQLLLLRQLIIVSVHVVIFWLGITSNSLRLLWFWSTNILKNIISAYVHMGFFALLVLKFSFLQDISHVNWLLLHVILITRLKWISIQAIYIKGKYRKC